LARLAGVLGLDQRELFLLAKPSTIVILRSQEEDQSRSGWDEFRKDDRLRHLHNISSEEMEVLSHIALMGRIKSARDFIHILNTLRYVLGR
jgi:hypothetical protein